MTNTIDCPNCGKTVPALNNSGHRRSYCSAQCAYQYRPILLAQQRAKQRIVHEYNSAALETWLQARRKRLARLERVPAA